MDRRTAIKTLSVTLGAAATAPTLFALLSSSTADATTWQARALSSEQQYVITYLVDVLIPNSDIPGALAVNVPQFIDKVYDQVLSAAEQQYFQDGAIYFSKKFTDTFHHSAITGSDAEFQQLIKHYFDIPKAQQSIIFAEQSLSLSEIDSDNKERYLIYHFLLFVRSNTLFGYFTSEKIGRDVLNFDPVPGVYEGCVPLSDIGNAWTN
ncbi:MAG: gluconate 2-dehydrogenase subunit 3 family protein [Oceanicoccus sp.]